MFTVIYHVLPISMKNSIVLLLCIFETTVFKHISQGATSATVMILSINLYQGMNIFIGVYMHI